MEAGKCPRAQSADQRQNDRFGWFRCNWRKVAQLLFGFGVRILYADPIRAPIEIERVSKAEHVSFDALIEQSDIVSLHLPLTDETAGIIAARVLARMKSGAVLVNCARGGLVDEVALHRFLADGHLAAAAIDTFAVEPVRESLLFALQQTILTPHTAGETIDNFRHVVERAVENTSRYLDGEELAPNELVVAPPIRAPPTLRCRHRREYMTPRAFMIANRWRQGSAKPFASINPSDGSVAAEICGASRADVDDAVEAARAALRIRRGAD